MFDDNNAEVRDYDDDGNSNFSYIRDTPEILSTSTTFRDLIFWDLNDASNMTSIDSSEHSVSKMEAYFYYYGIRGKEALGPKLIYRTSKDIFSIPSDPSQDLRMMELLTADDHNHDKFSQTNVLREALTDITDILDCEQMDLNWASIDVVRFRWEEPSKDEPSKTVTVTSPLTIWIRVHPDGTNGDTAFRASQDILKALKSYHIDDIEVAFCEY